MANSSPGSPRRNRESSSGCGNGAGGYRDYAAGSRRVGHDHGAAIGLGTFLRPYQSASLSAGPLALSPSHDPPFLFRAVSRGLPARCSASGDAPPLSPKIKED